MSLQSLYRYLSPQPSLYRNKAKSTKEKVERREERQSAKKEARKLFLKRRGRKVK